MKPAILWLMLLSSALWAEPERRLVTLKQSTLGQWAESRPEFDFTCYLPRRYQVKGLDSALVKASASSQGLPARVLGTFQADQLLVTTKQLGSPPPLLPLSLQATQPWTGVVAVRRDGRELAIRPGQWQPALGPSVADGLYRLTTWQEQGVLHYSDALRLGAPPSPAELQGPVQAIVSEQFLEQTLELYRQANLPRLQWRDPGGRASFELRQLGLTCLGGQLRAYSRFTGSVEGLGNWLEGQWEAPLNLRLQQGQARLQLNSQDQSLRLVQPFFAEVPSAWSQALQGMLERFLVSEVTLPIPGVYLQPLLDSQVVSQAELDQLELRPVSWGDRRNSALVLGQQPGPELPLQLGWCDPAGFALGLAAPAINRSLAAQIPRLLPLHFPLPQDRVPKAQVLFFTLDLKQVHVEQLQLNYQRGAFRFDNCRLSLDWQLGPLSGTEPGALLHGWATPTIEADSLALRFKIEYFEFLSPHVLGQSAAAQQKLREEIVQGLEKMPLPLPIPLRLATPVHPKALLHITQIRPSDEVLWLLGRWQP